MAVRKRTEAQRGQKVEKEDEGMCNTSRRG